MSFSVDPLLVVMLQGCPHLCRLGVCVDSLEGMEVARSPPLRALTSLSLTCPHPANLHTMLAHVSNHTVTKKGTFLSYGPVKNKKSIFKPLPCDLSVNLGKALEHLS